MLPANFLWKREPASFSKCVLFQDKMCPKLELMARVNYFRTLAWNWQNPF